MLLRGTVRIGAVAAGLIAVASGCAASGGDAAPPPDAAPTAGSNEIVPEPGRTIEAVPPTSVSGLDGYRVAAITADDSAGSVELLSAARSVASGAGADLGEFSADEADEDPMGAALAEALESAPDVIVALGPGTADVVGFESAQRLDQQFLVVGAQLPEPTDNVTAVIWEGATSRGSAVGPDDDLSDASITAERGTAALEAGLLSIHAGITGVVLRLA